MTKQNSVSNQNEKPYVAQADLRQVMYISFSSPYMDDSSLSHNTQWKIVGEHILHANYLLYTVGLIRELPIDDAKPLVILVKKQR